MCCVIRRTSNSVHILYHSNSAVYDIMMYVILLISRKCDTDNCATDNCATDKCATDKCATVKCAIDNCVTDKYSIDNYAIGKCATDLYDGIMRRI